MGPFLVTGAAGLIGRQALPLLTQAGREVHAIAWSKDAPVELASVAVWHRLNLLEPGAPAAIIEQVKPAGLLHLAWAAAPGTTNSDVNRDWLSASKELIRHFYENGGQRAVVAGSCFEYDWSEGICSEHNTPLSPNTVYGNCKLALYRFLEEFCSQDRLSWAWGRVFFVYGPHEHPGRFVPSVILSLLRNQPALCTHGRQIRDYLHCRDVAAALVLLLESGIVGPCNIASGQRTSLREIAEQIASSIGGRHLLEFGARPAPVGEPPMILADVARLGKELQFRPHMSLSDGLEETIAFWKQEACSSRAC